eukprot:310706-Hanusia_phi.AAC.1
MPGSDGTKSPSACCTGARLLAAADSVSVSLCRSSEFGRFEAQVSILGPQAPQYRRPHPAAYGPYSDSDSGPRRAQ